MMKRILISILLLFIFSSCAAVKSTLHTVGRSFGDLFRSPKKIENKITDPVHPEAGLALLWIGHATCLIQIDDKFILTDPNLVNTVAQFSKREVEPGITPENLPDIDAVIVSHMHIDHLSPQSLAFIENKTKQLLVPQQGLVYIPDFSFPMRELKMWQTWQKDGLKITAVPAIHNGWRYGVDDGWMKNSFCGYIIEYNNKRVYFAGDTAYDPELFRQIGQKYGTINLSLIPVAPIHPREFSKARHTDPREAVQMTLDMNSQYMVPIHYDTYPESIDVPGEATDSMHVAIRDLNIDADRVVILDIGEQHLFTLDTQKQSNRNSISK
jgi:L-ascorbate metabolism protein UlaG (beta-lactamase superfamily)